MPEISLHKPYPAQDVPQWDYETDVAVIGFGAAGACAAIEAADAGAGVMLFERNSGSGGASALSGGEIYMGGGTDVQRAAGFEDSAEDLAAYLKAAGGPCADEAKCDLYAREALSHYGWLKEQGVPYRGNYLPGKHIEPTDDSTLIWSGSEAAAPFCDMAKPAPRGHVIQHMGWGGGRPLVDILEASARAKGVDIQVDARAANRLHVPTRDSTIETQLLFKSGDPYRPEVLAESARILRDTRYLREARVRPVAFHDGVVDIEVTTQDVWTFNPGISFGRHGGKNTAGFELDYLEARHADTLAPVTSRADGPIRLLIAARLGATRLIDNIGV